jgi:hypothetical protein
MNELSDAPRNRSFFGFGPRRKKWSHFATTPGALAVVMMLALGGSARGGDASTAPIRALENSSIVAKSSDGELRVMKKDGTPINGLKLSHYDQLIDSPSIAVGPDGVIHVAFIERQVASPYTLYVFHRQSSDGGQNWSEAKNLSEDMPNMAVGHCRLLVDGQGRVYVVWRTGLAEGWPPSEGMAVNLVYRVLNNGKWSKIIPIHPPGSAAAQNISSIFSFAVMDPAGHAQVVWNACPDTFKPSETTVNGMHLAGIGNGLVFQATLDGSNPTPPAQIYMTPLTTDKTLGEYGKTCEDLSALDGYVDAAGAAHFIAIARAVRGGGADSQIDLFEGGKETPAIKLPMPYMETWTTPPRLLLDAQGHRHIIAFYHAGEHPAFRDYVVGSDDDPTVILTAKGPTATCLGFQAWQGPGGHMAVVMQTSERGFTDSGDSWISASDGTGWSQPVCVTGNAVRANYIAKNKGALLVVGSGDHYGPGPGAIAFDKDGNLLLALVNVKTGSFGLSAGGVIYAGGSTALPMLFFYKF